MLHVIYLVFNEGYSASSGAQLVTGSRSVCEKRSDSDGSLVELLPDPEATGLLALMLFHEARRFTAWPTGERVVLEKQDGSL